MIEVINAETCTSCNICVQVCPTNVFERRDSGQPLIARQADCQTCFMCELYCPDDALYVAPETDTLAGLTSSDVAAKGLFGSYRRSIGWTAETRAQRSEDDSYVLLKIARG